MSLDCSLSLSLIRGTINTSLLFWSHSSLMKMSVAAASASVAVASVSKPRSRIRAQTEPFWIQNHCLAFRFCCGCLCRSEATKIKHITLLFSVDCLNFSSSRQCAQTDRYPAQATALRYAVLRVYTSRCRRAHQLLGLETCICIKL